jgi:hypothetical protein
MPEPEARDLEGDERDEDGPVERDRGHDQQAPF